MTVTDDDIDLTQPFEVIPIIYHQPITAHDVHVKVVPVDGGQDVHAWLTGHPKHPLTGEDINPRTVRLELPGVEMPAGMKREAFHLVHPDTNAGVALAINPVTSEIIGWYSCTLAMLDDLELGVPEDWLNE